jgi:hypothetical protein
MRWLGMKRLLCHEEHETLIGWASYPLIFFFLFSSRKAKGSYPLLSSFFSSPHRGKSRPWKEEANQRVMDTKKKSIISSYSLIHSLFAF